MKKQNSKYFLLFTACIMVAVYSMPSMAQESDTAQPAAASAAGQPAEQPDAEKPAEQPAEAEGEVEVDTEGTMEVSADAEGEDGESFFSPMGGMGYFMIGVRFIDMDDVSGALNDWNYSDPYDSHLSIGGGGQFNFGPLIIGGEGHGLMGIGSKSAHNELDYKADISGGYGLFRLGYNVFSYEGFNIYPLIGFGGGTASMHIAEAGDITFDQALGNPKREIEMHRDSFLIDISLGLDYRIDAPYMHGSEDEKSENGYFVVGIRGGYMFAPVQSDWYTAEGTIIGGPDLGIDGPAVMLILGSGGWHSYKN